MSNLPPEALEELKIIRALSNNKLSLKHRDTKGLIKFLDKKSATCKAANNLLILIDTVIVERKKEVLKKKVVQIVTVILFLFLAISATTTNEFRLAEANQQEGVYIFVDSKPVAKYDYLGTVKTNCCRQYKGIRNKLLKKAKKSFPDANGLIIRFSTGGIDRADVIFLTNQ